MRLLIVGAGGHGKSVAEAALASGMFTLSGFLDDKVTHVWGVPVLGEIQKITAWRTVADTAIVAMGDNVLRQQLQHQLRLELPLGHDQVPLGSLDLECLAIQ